MKRSLMLISLVLAMPAFAATRAYDLKLQPHEWIGAAVARNDGSALITIASHEPRRTRLVQLAANGSESTISVPGIAINAMRPLRGSGTYFAGGSIGDRYVHRIVRVRGNALETVWDSSAIPEQVRRNEPWVIVSDDARLWGAVSETKEGAAFTWGSTTEATPRATITISSSSNVPFPEGFTFDATTAVFLDDDTAVVVNRGRGHVLSLSQGKRVGVLNPPTGAGQLIADGDARTLWIGANEWYAYPFDDVRTDAAQRPARTLAIGAAGAPDRLTSPDAKTRVVLRDGVRGSVVAIERR